MKYVDAHCHIFKEYYDDPKDVVDCDVQILVTGTNLSTNLEMRGLQQDNVDVAMGAYPIDLLENLDINDALHQIEENMDNIVAVGEIGMDFYHADKSTMQTQIDNITRLVNLANKYNKPVVVHSRKAEKEVIELLSTIAKTPVVNHCFSGKKGLIKQGVAAGMYFTVPANVVYSGHFQSLVKLVPITQLLTETDSPYLWREYPNKPHNVQYAVEKIAEIKGVPVTDVKQQIYDNYLKIFKTHKK